MANYTRSPIEKWTALYVCLSRDDDNEGDSNSISHHDILVLVYPCFFNIFQSVDRPIFSRLAALL